MFKPTGAQPRFQENNNNDQILLRRLQMGRKINMTDLLIIADFLSTKLFVFLEHTSVENAKYLCCFLTS